MIALLTLLWQATRHAVLLSVGQVEPRNRSERVMSIIQQTLIGSMIFIVAASGFVLFWLSFAWVEPAGEGRRVAAVA